VSELATRGHSCYGRWVQACGLRIARDERVSLIHADYLGIEAR